MINRKFNPTKATKTLEAIENGFRSNTVEGIEIRTFGADLHWQTLEVPQDKTVIVDKRDRFNKRNDFCNVVADAGVVEYALAYAPKLDQTSQAAQQTQGSGRRGYAVKCAFCGAGHNWVVFYRRASDKSYLGYSGVSCFKEIIENLQIPAMEAVIKAMTKEENRCKKFIMTMEKVTDFKRDFPGLYEHRKILILWKNPYARLWAEVMQRLNSAHGVNEEYLAECEKGTFDRRGRYNTDESARRIPAFLRHLSQSVQEHGLDATLAGLVEKAKQEPVGSPFRRIAANMASKVDITEEQKAKAVRLLNDGYGWSSSCQAVAAGNADGNQLAFVLECHASLYQVNTFQEVTVAG